MPTIPVLLDDATPDNHPPRVSPGTLGLGSERRGPKVKELDTDKLRDSLTGLSAQLQEVFRDIKQVGDFQLKQVQVSVEVNAASGFVLIGSASIGAKGAITLTFTA
jgi:hypothetical protein